MKLNTLLIPSLLAITALAAQAQPDSVTIQTRYGILKTSADGDLQFKGKTLTPSVSLVSQAYVIKVFKLSSADVVLVSRAAGNACPGQYAYITVTAEGAKATPTFGTCYDDEIKPDMVGESIAFSMKGLRGKGSTRYIYERGIVFENGKPLTQ